jgi:hypothetical protein
VSDEEPEVSTSVPENAAPPRARTQDEHDDRDPADRAPSWGPESLPAERGASTSDAPSPKATHAEWDRLLDEADAPPPVDSQPADHPDVPDSARRMLRDDQATG